MKPEQELVSRRSSDFNASMQAFMKKHFPTGEVFASLAAFILHVALPYERKILDFREKHFKQYNIGIQIRRRKCRTDSSYELELPCQEQPSVMEYCQVRPCVLIWDADLAEDVASRMHLSF